MEDSPGPAPWATRGAANGRGDRLDALVRELSQTDEREFKFSTWEELELADLNAGGIQWTVHGLFERGTTVVLYGPPGASKTFVAVDMALSVAMGQPFAGRGTHQGLVAYIGGEGPRAFGRRLRAWRHGRGIDEITDGFLYLGERVGVVDERNVHVLGSALAEHSRRLDLPVELVVFDTWQRHLEGDESSTGDVAKACRNLSNLRERLDCCIVILHHTGWSEATRMRGSRVLEGECDSLFQVDLDDERNVTTVTCERMRDGDRPPPLTFQGHRVELPQSGVSWYTVYDGALRPTPGVESKLGPKEKNVLKELKKLWQEESDRMAARGNSPAAVELTSSMIRERMEGVNLFVNDTPGNKALSNVLRRLAEKRLVAKRGRNLVVT